MATLDVRPTDSGTPRYRVRWQDRDDRWHSRTFAAKREAERFARRVEVDKERGIAVVDERHQPAIDALADQWLAQQRMKLRPRVWSNYEASLRLHVRPAFGRRKVGHIEPSEVLDWVAEREAAGVSPTTIALAHNLLGRLFAFAIRERVLAVSPVIHDEYSPRRPSDRRERFLAEDEVERLAEAIDGRYRAWLYFMTYSGVRFGEAAALTVANVNPMRRAVTIEASLQDVAGRVSVGPPKTAAGVRVVIVPKFVADLLAEQIAGKSPEDFVFTSPEGGPLRKENMRRRVWLPAITAAGLAGVRIHDLRHSAASWLADERVPWPEIARSLGHSSPAFTMSRYAHPVSTQAVEAADAMERRRAEALARKSNLVKL